MRESASPRRSGSRGLAIASERRRERREPRPRACTACTSSPKSRCSWVAPPTESEAIHKELLGIATEWCTDLGLAWRALDMPTEELGASAWRKFDVEVWMPGLARWGEVASITNCTDFQARRLDVKMASGGGGGGGGGGPEFAHTLNGTACAVPRTLVALMETHQRDDGSIVLPPVVAEEVGWDVVS